MAPRIRWVCLSAVLFGSCLFETGIDNGIPSDGPEAAFPAIRPDLTPGNRWMYRNRTFTEFHGGGDGDTVSYFIRYSIPGDSVIASVRYRILVEEELALFNTDVGLVKVRSAYAVQADSDSVLVFPLQGFDNGSGRLPFKAAAPAFDSLRFKDRLMALKMPLIAGRGWTYREPGSGSGSWAAAKVFLGRDTLRVEDSSMACLKFRVKVDNQDYIRRYEWYADGLKVLSRASSSTTFGGLDSLRSEEAFVGRRDFTREDTLAVLRGTILDPETGP